MSRLMVDLSRTTLQWPMAQSDVMVVTCDPEAKATYLAIGEKPRRVVYTKPITDSVRLDLDADGRIIGIEIA